MFPQYSNLVKTNSPIAMYDPFDRTLQITTWNSPNFGENAILVGFPQHEKNYPNGAVTFGKILSDLEASRIILELQDVGDSEGDIPYKSIVEFLVEAQGLAGMSGGGVFNLNGELIGIMVRASDTEEGPKIIRVIRITYIRDNLINFYKDLSNNEKENLDLI